MLPKMWGCDAQDFEEEVVEEEVAEEDDTLVSGGLGGDGDEDDDEDDLAAAMVRDPHTELARLGLYTGRMPRSDGGSREGAC